MVIENIVDSVENTMDSENKEEVVEVPRKIMEKIKSSYKVNVYVLVILVLISIRGLVALKSDYDNRLSANTLDKYGITKEENVILSKNEKANALPEVNAQEDNTLEGNAIEGNTIEDNTLPEDELKEKPFFESKPDDIPKTRKQRLKDKGFN